MLGLFGTGSYSPSPSWESLQHLLVLNGSLSGQYGNCSNCKNNMLNKHNCHCFLQTALEWIHLKLDLMILPLITWSHLVSDLPEIRSCDNNAHMFSNSRACLWSQIPTERYQWWPYIILITYTNKSNFLQSTVGSLYCTAEKTVAQYTSYGYHIFFILINILFFSACRRANAKEIHSYIDLLCNLEL